MNAHPVTTFCLVLAFVMLSACSGSDSGSGNGAPAGTASQLFASSNAVNERFGDLRARDLSPDPGTTERAAVVTALNDFSLMLHSTVASAADAPATIESGYSAAIALSLASAGTDGATRAGLSALLGFDAIDEEVRHRALNALALELDQRANEGLVLRTANRVFVEPGLPLQAGFMDTATGQYGAPITEADFAGSTEEVRQLINAWVALQTDDFIPSILDQLDPGTVFVMLNAIFLDARWQDDYEAVDSLSFTLGDGSVAEVPGFTGRSSLPRSVSDNLTAMEIPYFGGELAMLILVPESLPDFEATLTASTLNDIIAGMDTVDVQFRVPDWQASADLNLYQLLLPLGLPQNAWNFGRMIEGDAGLDVLVKQKARIEVDKDGTRAAAVTGVIGTTSVPQMLDIDKPFMYVLRDRSSSVVLFTGRVTDPR